MKRNFLIAVAFAATITVGAQNIAVVSPDNATKLYQTLDEAISEAAPKSIIYLPGGGVTVSDETMIDKRLTIMGVSHRGDTDNADGATVITGNLNFVGGSSGSSVMGVYLSGNVNIATETDSVTDFTLRYCNVKSVQVKNSRSTGMIVNQCYLRGSSNFSNCNVRLANNIFASAQNIQGGIIDHNIITSSSYYWTGNYGGNCEFTLWGVSNTTLTNNFLLYYRNHNDWCKFENCHISNNCIGTGSWGENPVKLDEDKNWNDVFKTYYDDASKRVSISSDYHLISAWGKGAASDGTDIGIYGGAKGEASFKDKALAPIPRIVSKEVDEQTDGTGKLKIKVKVVAQ